MLSLLTPRIVQTLYPLSATLTPSLKFPDQTAKTVLLLPPPCISCFSPAIHPHVADVVGLTVLDEPAANQTDPTGALHLESVIANA
jgi:hypothetical protein